MRSAGLLDVAQRVAITGEPHHQRNVPATGEKVNGRVVDVSIVPLDGGAVAMTFIDVTDQRAAESRLQDLAERDQLTGLWNRTRFDAELSSRLARRLPTALALLDLNSFKQVNETLGHSNGDLLLQVLGDRFRGQLPSDWLVARLGGDEFAIAAPAGDHHGDEFAHRIAHVATAPVQLGAFRVSTDVAIGVAVSPDDGTQVNALMGHADTALCRAKTSGNRFAVSGERDRSRSQQRQHLHHQLDESFERDEFAAYVQPIVDLERYEIVGVEALARWVVPGNGVMTPDVFLGLLSMAGQNAKLTDFMLERAADLVHGGRFVSVNLCPSDLHRDDIVDVVNSAVELSAARGSGEIWLEIVEAQLFDVGRTTVDALIGTGAELAIDDFGAAFSSLNRLIDHEVSVLKIDRALLRNLGTNRRARLVLKSVVDAAHNLGAKVVAEGVETMEACSVVEDLGCDLVQGYLLGRPVPSALVEDLLRDGRRLCPEQWPDLEATRAWEAEAVGPMID